MLIYVPLHKERKGKAQGNEADSNYKYYNIYPIELQGIAEIPYKTFLLVGWYKVSYQKAKAAY
ncbi:MAG: hypothetical protein J5906_09220 [Acidaminococcaceae bacterium]|nr:hypothetical protein [Acidaminococcaceae bacterium]